MNNKFIDFYKQPEIVFFVFLLFIISAVLSGFEPITTIKFFIGLSLVTIAYTSAIITVKGDRHSRNLENIETLKQTKEVLKQQVTAITSIQRHINDTSWRIDAKTKQIEECDNPADIADIQADINNEIAFRHGLSRALQYLAEGDKS